MPNIRPLYEASPDTSDPKPNTTDESSDEVIKAKSRNFVAPSDCLNNERTAIAKMKKTGPKAGRY